MTTTNKEKVDITSRHTFGIRTYARGWREYGSADELRSALVELQRAGEPFMPIGQGSNLLFVNDYGGVLLHSSIRTFTVVRETADAVWVEAGSGLLWDDFVARCVASGWYGVENLSYIPGEVGASAVQNIGAYGVEACDAIACVDAIATESLEGCRVDTEECRYGYRTRIFKHELKGKYIITSVTFRLSKLPAFKLGYGNLRTVVGESPTLPSVRDAVIRIRKDKLPEPSELGSAGSFFVNPVILRSAYEALLEKHPDMPCYEVDEEHVKVPAGWLIDRLGWRGKSVGGAQVYPRQCLVIVNTGRAVADNVVRLAEAIADSVYGEYGIRIHPEVNYIK